MRFRYAWVLCLTSCFDPAPKTNPPDPSATRSAETEAPSTSPAAGRLSPSEARERLRASVSAAATKANQPTEEVKRLCAAIHTLARKRRAECCQTELRFTLQPECERRLQAVIGPRSAQLSGTLDRCVTRMQTVLSDCDWVGPHWLPLPTECLDLLRGRVPKGQPCRSHLVCQPGLFCAGLTEDDPGTCQASRAIGEKCDLGPDSLATILQQDVDEKHAPCADGYCRVGKCVAFSAIGSPCGAKNGCGPKARCVEGLCVTGRLGQRGQSCAIGDCAAGLRCINARCDKPKAPGARCQTDEACYGTCEKGKCVRTCGGRITSRPLSRP